MSSRVSAWFVDTKGHLDRVTIQGVIGAFPEAFVSSSVNWGHQEDPPASRML